MAKEKALEKLGELLKCSICLDDYTVPRLLPCSHVYCQDCLKRLVNRGAAGRHTVSCPTCREVIPVPPRGVVGFQSAYRINSLIEVHKTLSEADPLKAFCSIHKKELDCYCLTCDDLLCWKCAYKSDEHPNHVLEDVEDVFTFCKDGLLHIVQLIHAHFCGTEEDQERMQNLLALFRHYINGGCKIETVKMCMTLKNTLQDLAPGLARAVGMGLEVAVLGKKSTIMVKAFVHKSLEGVLVTELTGTRVNCETEERDEFTHEITYQPIEEGAHKLNILLDGQHIKGSPFSVVVEPLAQNKLFILPGKRPYGVVIKQGRVIFSEEDGHCISEFTKESSIAYHYGSHGSGEGQFDSPRGIAIDAEQNILVADSGNHRIQKFTANHTFLAAVGRKGNGRLEFSHPSGVAVNPVNQMVYVVDRNHRVQVLNSDLTFSAKFGTHGSGQRQFNDPHGVACDSTGKVYVADTRNHRIQVFTAEMEFLMFFDDAKSKLRYPSRVAVNPHTNYMFVGQKDNIHLFSSKGHYEGLVDLKLNDEKIGNFCGVASDNELYYMCTNDFICISPKNAALRPTNKILIFLLVLLTICFFTAAITTHWYLRSGPIVFIAYLSFLLFLISLYNVT